MHWPSFLAGLLVLPAFVLFAALTQSLVQAIRRRSDGFVGGRPSAPLARGGEPLEFTSRVMGRISREGSSRASGGSARAS